MTVDGIVAMAASRSSVVALDPRERAEVLDGVRTLLATHPQTAGRTTVELPYRTNAFRTTRRGHSRGGNDAGALTPTH